MAVSHRANAECANLLGDHINFQTGNITLYRSKTDTGYVIPIFPQLRPFLERLKNSGRIQNSQRVFKINDPNKAITGACKRLNFPH